MRPSTEHQPWFEHEIRSWLQDDQQLTELGRRCVTAMLTNQLVPASAAGATQSELLRALLVEDWLSEA